MGKGRGEVGMKMLGGSYEKFIKTNDRLYRVDMWVKGFKISEKKRE